jgi:hypothetical protein
LVAVFLLFEHRFSTDKDEAKVVTVTPYMTGVVRFPDGETRSVTFSEPMHSGDSVLVRQVEDGWAAEGKAFPNR